MLDGTEDGSFEAAKGEVELGNVGNGEAVFCWIGGIFGGMSN